jgi:hypothetical protein
MVQNWNGMRAGNRVYFSSCRAGFFKRTAFQIGNGLKGGAQISICDCVL